MVRHTVHRWRKLQHSNVPNWYIQLYHNSLLIASNLDSPNVQYL